MHWSWVPAVFALAAGAVHTDVRPELVALSRVRAVMSETLARQPDYTCVQQIERSRRRVPRRRFELHDVLRLEVALVDGKEMYAWPGARKFEQTDLSEMIAGGAIGTGDFALHARAVFRSSAPVFTYAGPAELRGHKAERFDFRVTRINSGYHIKSPGHEAVVGYHGSFWADIDTHELVRLEINADDIPKEIGIAVARDVMDYDRMSIGGAEFLLPSASELTMIDLSGNESRNRTQFKSCRQYAGESVLTFDGPPPDEAPAPAPAPAERMLDLPADIVLEARLATDIDSRSAAVGDPVEVVLEQRLRVKKRVLLDKGARLLGRILRLEPQGEYTLLDIRFSEVDSQATRAPVSARVEELIALPPFDQVHSPFQLRPHRPFQGIHIRGHRIHLTPGCRMRLRTLAAKT